MSEPLTVDQVCRALDRLNRGWPENLELVAWNGTLNLVAINPENPSSVGVYEEDVLGVWPQIICDGGDPDDLPGSAWDGDD